MGRQGAVIGLAVIILVGLYLFYQATQPTYVDPEVQINPDRHYTLEFWDYPLPMTWEDGTNYRDLVQELIAQFEKEHPNITINYRPLPFAQGPELLEQALGRGSPPDVYSEPFPRGIVYHPGLQLPITDFLAPEELASYSPGVLAAVEWEGDLWGWPVWFSPLVWAGNRPLLEGAGLDVSQVQTLGWNWEEFLDLARQLAAGGEGAGIVFSTGPGAEELFYHLLANNGPTSLGGFREEGDGGLVRLAEAAAFTHLLCSEGLWRGGETDPAWLENFWAGRAALVGPVNTWVIRGAGIRALQARHQPDLVFLPPPHGIGAREYSAPTLALVRVFRQRRFQGADQVKAAMEFARYFSQKQGQAVAQRLWSLPAYRPGDLLAGGEGELSPANIRFLLRSQDYLLPLPRDLAQWRQEEKWKGEVLSPGLEKLLSGELTPREFAEQVFAQLQ
ncbi:MAG: extracellular solute-binding protein [bacterium]